MGAVTSTLERMVIDVTWSCHEWFYGSKSAPKSINPRPDITRPRRYRRHHRNIPSSSSGSSSSRSSRSSISCDGCGSPRRRPGQVAVQERLVSLAPTVVADDAVPTPSPTSSMMPPSIAAMAAAAASGAASRATNSSDGEDDWPPSPRRFARDHCGVLERPAATSTPDHGAVPVPHRRRRATMSLMYSRRQHGQHHHHASDGGDDVILRRVPKRPSVPYSTLQAMLFRCTAARNGCLSSKDYERTYPVRGLGRSWSVHNATVNRAATL